MNTGRHILVVSQNSRTVNTLIAWLSPAGHELSVVNSFAAGKVNLNSKPDLLITDLKLQEHNGLHLALRAQSSGIPAIVIGPDDQVLRRDALELGATYLSALPARGDLLKLVGDSVTHRSADAMPPVHAGTEGEMMWNYIGGSRPSVPVDSHGRRVLLH